jgi:hypothetical protein
LATTVATPSKCPGREAPHSPSPSPATETVVAKPWRIDLLDRRRPQQVDPFRREQPRVLGQLARVGGEVLVGAELRRVDEDRDRHRARLLARFAHQRQVSFVQRAHRRDQRESRPLRTQAVHSGA